MKLTQKERNFLRSLFQLIESEAFQSISEKLELPEEVVETAYQEGYDHFINGNTSGNPYTKMSRQYIAYEEGFDAASEEVFGYSVSQDKV